MVLDVFRALGRRWYVVVIGLVSTAALVFGAAKASPPEYHARALVLLLPSQSAVGDGGNPFLQLSGLEQPAGILVAYFSSAPARAEVEKFSPTAEYQVGIEDSTRGPVIAVDVTAATESETMTTLDHLVSGLPEELARLQDQVNAPVEARIGSMPLAADDEPEIDRSATVRLMIAALVIGLVGTGFCGYGIDSLVQRHKSRQPRRRRLNSRRSTKRAPTSTDAEPSSTESPQRTIAESAEEYTADPGSDVDPPATEIDESSERCSAGQTRLGSNS